MLAVVNVTFARTFWLQIVSLVRCTVTSKTYFIKGNLPCDSCNVIYLITWSDCREQHERSTINFKRRIRIHKSDIKTNKDRCGTARHFNNKCCSPNNKHPYLKIQIIEQVFNNTQFRTEDLFWEWEKYWQAQLFTNLYGMNNINDLYSIKRKGYQSFWTDVNIFNDILRFWF